MARDISDVALNTMMVYLASETGIATGNFFFQYPNDDYVNGRTFQSYPSVGIIETDMRGGTRFTYSNYGCIHLGDENDDGTQETFFPLGRKRMIFMIDLWAETQAQRRKYRNLVEIALLKSKSLLTDDFDPVPGESIELNLMEYSLTDDKPYGVSFMVEVTGSVFRQENNYIVNQIEVLGTLGQNLSIDTTVSGASWLTITSGGITVNDDV